MAITNDSNGFYMPVGPANGNNYGGDMWGWFILMIILASNGGWGMGNFGGAGNMALGYDFPWLLNGQGNINANTNSGFDHAETRAAIGDLAAAVSNGFAATSTQLCGVNATVNGAQNNISQQLYTNQIADMERSYAAQTAGMQGLNAIQTQISTESCSTRATDTQNTQAIIETFNTGIQSIKDMLRQNQIDAKNDEIAQLRQENLYARGQASQIAQNANIIDGIYNRLSQCPVDSTPVFGRQPIFTNPNTVGSPCGCGFAN